MNREEAENMSDKLGLDYSETKNLIDYIYDDFESRTCESCRYKTIDGTWQKTGKPIYKCKLLVSFGNWQDTINLTDGCNKYEKK